jgi:lipopolysaccharide/colanic/teichoic acid biosynthesis glycosyltransferase
VRETFYSRYVKDILDRVLGILGLICLSWLYAIIAIAIVIDDPGPVLFKQKRVGKKKNGEITYFNILKFRSMKMSTPHDVPTHMLDNPEQYITQVGKVLRKTSLDGIVKIGQTLKNPVKSMVSQVSSKQFLESCSFNFLQHNRNLVDNFPTCQTVWIG